MNRCRACSPWFSRTLSSCSVASAKPAPDVRTSRASRPASIARCSSTTSARVSRDRMRTSTVGSVMPDTVRQALPAATPSSSKSVDKSALLWPRTRAGQRPYVFGLWWESAISAMTRPSALLVRDVCHLLAGVSLRHRCCGYVAPFAVPRARPARKTFGCTYAAPQPDSCAAAWISAPRSSASH